LYALLSGLATGGSPALVSASRRLIDIQEADPATMPAGFQLQDDIPIKKEVQLPPVYKLQAHWILYVYEGDETAPVSPLLNAGIKAMLGALVPPGGEEANTLGGLVTDCFAEGTIKVFEGLLGNKAVAIIPISILVPGF
jgi:hypothetical protein